MPEWSEQRIARLRRLWADETLSVSDIAERLGVTSKAVSALRWRLALPPRPRGSAWAPRPRRRAA